MKEERQITRSAGLVGLLTLASRILGLIRDGVVAALFSKKSTDPFFVAYTIPNMMRQLLAEGSLTVAFIPVFTDYQKNSGEEAARAFLRNMLGGLLLTLALVSLAGMFLAPWVVKLFALGFLEEPAKFDLAVKLTRIMFVYLVAAGLTALAMGVLNSLRHFYSPALAPVVLNICIILTVLTGVSWMIQLGYPSIFALAIGVVLGGLAQVILQLPALGHNKMLVLPHFNLRDPGVIKVARLMLPALFGLAVYQVNIILSRQFASFLPEGSISYLYYAQRLVEFPMGIFAVAIATVAMPNLSSHASAGNMEALKATYRFSLGLVLFVILPASAGLCALALPLTSMLFQRGEFRHEMAIQTAITLYGLLAGLWAGAGVRQTVPVYYALQEPQTPVKVAAGSVIIYALVALALYRPLGTLGLTLAVSCASVSNFCGLVFLLRRRLGPLGLRGLGSSFVKSVVAAGAAAMSAHGVAALGQWEQGGMVTSNYGLLLGAVGAGIMAYVIVSRLLGTPELVAFWQAFRQRQG